MSCSCNSTIQKCPYMIEKLMPYYDTVRCCVHWMQRKHTTWISLRSRLGQNNQDFVIFSGIIFQKWMKMNLRALTWYASGLWNEIRQKSKSWSSECRKKGSLLHAVKSFPQLLSFPRAFRVWLSSVRCKFSRTFEMHLLQDLLETGSVRSVHSADYFDSTRNYLCRIVLPDSNGMNWSNIHRVQILFLQKVHFCFMKSLWIY